MNDPAAVADADQYATAAAHTSRQLRNLATDDTRTPAPAPAPAWVHRISDQMRAVTRRLCCRHMRTPGHQPVNLLAWVPDVYLCTTCARTAAVWEPATPRQAVCTACQQPDRVRLTLSVFQPVGVPVLVWCELCDTCLRDMGEEPGDTDG